MRIGVIGGGNMAEALVAGWLSGGRAQAEEVVICEPVAERRAYWQATYGVRVSAENTDALAGTELVLLAVKPQTMAAALSGLSSATYTGIWISIAAGVPTERLGRSLGRDSRLIRVMPNTPALVGAGVSALCRGGCASEADLAIACGLFEAVGEVLVVEESEIDAVTAVSGSGPAYFFRLVEAMAEGGVALGLSPDKAMRLAAGTLTGAGRLLAQSGVDAAELRRRVTSPGGTTAAALGVMAAADFAGIVVRAELAAAERSRELSGQG